MRITPIALTPAMLGHTIDVTHGETRVHGPLTKISLNVTILRKENKRIWNDATLTVGDVTVRLGEDDTIMVKGY